MGAGDAALAALLTGAIRQIHADRSGDIAHTLQSMDWQDLLKQSMMQAALACRRLGGLPREE
jgi:sugar/nucleoside kinase (ribokinase family)